MGPAGLGGKGRRLEAELNRHPQHVEIGEVDHLAVEIGAPVAVDHDREEQARDQEEIRHPERLCEGDQRMHEAVLAGGQFHAQHRMHHHHHDDADALGVVHPVDTARRCLRRGRRSRGTLGDGGCAVWCHRCSFSARFWRKWRHHRPYPFHSPLFIQMTCRLSRFSGFLFAPKCFKTRPTNRFR